MKVNLLQHHEIDGIEGREGRDDPVEVPFRFPEGWPDLFPSFVKKVHLLSQTCISDIPGQAGKLSFSGRIRRLVVSDFQCFHRPGFVFGNGKKRDCSSCGKNYQDQQNEQRCHKVSA